MRLVIVAAIPALLLLISGCGDDEEPSRPEPTVAPTSAAGAVTPEPNGLDQDTRTGIEEVDAVIDAVLGRDVEGLKDLVALQPIACIGPATASLGALFCAGAEREGDVVDVLPVAECQSHYVRAGDLDLVLNFAESTQLYAVYRVNADHRIVFSQRAVEDGPLFGVTVGTESGRITYMDFGCGQTAERLVESVAEDGFLIEPP